MYRFYLHVLVILHQCNLNLLNINKIFTGKKIDFVMTHALEINQKVYDG